MIWRELQYLPSNHGITIIIPTNGSTNGKTINDITNGNKINLSNLWFNTHNFGFAPVLSI